MFQGRIAGDWSNEMADKLSLKFVYAIYIFNNFLWKITR